MPAQRLLLRCVSFLLLGLVAASARADLQDEIQVYDDGINAPGEWGVELHANSTPSGRGMPAWPGERVSLHGWRLTPEISLGLSKQWEAGLYLPVVHDRTGHTSLAGVKVRLKWLPLQSTDTPAGWFAGANLELARVREVYDLARDSGELKLIGGRRAGPWLFAANVNLGKAFTGPDSAQRPDLGLGLKAAWHAHPAWAPGVELYAETGPLGHPLPASQQDRRVFATLDHDGALPFNLGLGRGLNAASDKWTLKAILDLPF